MRLNSTILLACALACKFVTCTRAAHPLYINLPSRYKLAHSFYRPSYLSAIIILTAPLPPPIYSTHPTLTQPRPKLRSGAMWRAHQTCGGRPWTPPSPKRTPGPKATPAAPPAAASRTAGRASCTLARRLEGVLRPLGVEGVSLVEVELGGSSSRCGEIRRIDRPESQHEIEFANQVGCIATSIIDRVGSRGQLRTRQAAGLVNPFKGCLLARPYFQASSYQCIHQLSPLTPDCPSTPPHHQRPLASLHITRSVRECRSCSRRRALLGLPLAAR